MPFITEKIYKELYNNDESIMIAEYPEHNEKLNFKKQEEQIEQIKELITGIRNVRTKMNVHPSKKSKLIFIAKPEYKEEIKIQKDKTNIPQNAINLVTADLEVFIPFEDLVDIE